MADYGFSQSPKDNHKQPISSFFSSPKLFTSPVSKTSNDTDFTMSSPTSVLDPKPFLPKNKQENTKSHWENLDSKKVGLSLVNTLIDERPDSNLSKMVVFGSQLKILQVPTLPHSVLLSPNESPKSPGDFGIKTRMNSLVGSFSPRLSKSPFGSSNSGVFSTLSASEMELSEDYTCVISYGPNPRTTHIFDDCIVNSCCGVVKFSESRKKNNRFFADRSTSYPSESFLSCCYNCKKNLGQGKDIYMYRGEKAFCSNECRSKEMMLDDEALEPNYVYGTSS